MTTETKPDSRTIQIGVRLTPEEDERLTRAVATLNERAFEAGLPPTCTVSNVVRMWIQERLDFLEGTPPEEQATRQMRPATSVNKALEKLRGSR